MTHARVRRLRARPLLNAALLGMLAAMVWAMPARALGLLRDADIEHALLQLARPVLGAAGLPAGSMRVLMVDDREMNAFVADAETIFVTAGMIQRLDTAAQLQAVFAHEAAHIANGHLSKRGTALGSARTAAGLGLLLGVAAMAASGEDAAGVAVAAGAQSAAIRRFLSHSRAEESAADIASVRYMAQAGIDPQAAAEVQNLFAGQSYLSTAQQDPYLLSHPTNRDRQRALAAQIVGLNASMAPDPTRANGDAYWFARAQGKLSAFRQAPSWTLRRASDSATRDIQLMREAVAHHRNSDTKSALGAINAAIALRPNDGFLLELKGQILLESRNFGEATATYRQAATLLPREPLVQAGLGRALLATGQTGAALQVLEGALGRDHSDARMLRDLSLAYARSDRPAMASLVTAERYALQGRLKDGEIHAERAADRLPVGSGPWRRAQDVLNAAERAR